MLLSLTTLDAVPPGQHESNIKPTETEGGSPKDLLIINPRAGIIVYWATHPKSICSKWKTRNCKQWKYETPIQLKPSLENTEAHISVKHFISPRKTNTIFFNMSKTLSSELWSLTPSVLPPLFSYFNGNTLLIFSFILEMPYCIVFNN